MFGAISEKFRTFDMQINFAIPPISHFRRWLGEFFFPLSKLRNFYHFINQFVKKAKKLFGHFTTVPNYAPDGIKVSLSEEDIRSRFPWSRKDVIDRCCDRYTNFKQNADMNSVFSKIKENSKLSHARRLYPNKERPVTFFYSANVLKEFDKHYTKK